MASAPAQGRFRMAILPECRMVAAGWVPENLIEMGAIVVGDFLCDGCVVACNQDNGICIVQGSY